MKGLTEYCSEFVSLPNEKQNIYESNGNKIQCPEHNKDISKIKTIS